MAKEHLSTSQYYHEAANRAALLSLQFINTIIVALNTSVSVSQNNLNPWVSQWYLGAVLTVSNGTLTNRNCRSKTALLNQ